MIIPNRLQKGDKIGVVAPSSPLTSDDLEAVNNSISLMEASGFSIEFGKNTFSNSLGYSSAAKEKAEDINAMFANPEIKAIFCASGGFNANSTFEYLDYGLISQNPKIICGFSDSTALLNMITAKTGIVTFHGATFKALTSWATDLGYQEVINRFVRASTDLAEPDDTFYAIQEGFAQGELVGGNLSCFSQLITGKYSVDVTNKILFLEELCLETPPALVHSRLSFLKQNDVFSKIKGLWIGNYDGSAKLEKIVLDVLENNYRFPIIKSNNFGHIEKKMVIPIGTKASIDTSKEIKIELIENCIL